MNSCSRPWHEFLKQWRQLNQPERCRTCDWKADISLLTESNPCSPFHNVQKEIQFGKCDSVMREDICTFCAVIFYTYSVLV